MGSLVEMEGSQGAQLESGGGSELNPRKGREPRADTTPYLTPSCFLAKQVPIALRVS